MSSARPQSPKKPYQTPQFRVYGDIRQITQMAANTGIHAEAKTKTA